MTAWTMLTATQALLALGCFIAFSYIWRRARGPWWLGLNFASAFLWILAIFAIRAYSPLQFSAWWFLERHGLPILVMVQFFTSALGTAVIFRRHARREVNGTGLREIEAFVEKVCRR